MQLAVGAGVGDFLAVGTEHDVAVGEVVGDPKAGDSLGEFEVGQQRDIDRGLLALAVLLDQVRRASGRSRRLAFKVVR